MNVVLQCINNVYSVCFICLLSMFTTVYEQFVTYFQLADPWSSKLQHNVKDERRVCCKADDWVALFCHERKINFFSKSRNMHKLRSYTLLNLLTYHGYYFFAINNISL